MYLKRKPYNVLFESNTETERIFVMRGSKLVLVEVVLFQLKGHGHPHDDATPNFFPNSKGSILGLSNEVSFVSELFQEGGQNRESIFPKICCTKIYVHQCMKQKFDQKLMLQFQ